VHFTPLNQWASLRDALEKKPETDFCLVLVEIFRNGWNLLNEEVFRVYDFVNK
jgi:hypothetical protein